MRELIIMFLQGLLYIIAILYITFICIHFYKEYSDKIEPYIQEEQEQPVVIDKPLYVLSPNKEG